jgi:hypothetical protein
MFGATAHIWGNVTLGTGANPDIMTWCGDICADPGDWQPVVCEYVNAGTFTVTDGCLTGWWEADIDNYCDDIVDYYDVLHEIDWGSFWVPRLWKTIDAGETWIDHTAKVQPPLGAGVATPLSEFRLVSAAPDNEEWLAIAGYGCDAICAPYPTPPPPFTCTCDKKVMVVASQDGADHFTYTGDTVDAANGTTLTDIYDMDISPLADGVHNIALGGMAYNAALTCDPTYGAVYRLQAGTWLSAAWEDTTFYPGWMPLDSVEDPPCPSPSCLLVENPYWWKPCAVTSVQFSPNFETDLAIVTMGNSYDMGPDGCFTDWMNPASDDVGQSYYIQTGSWEAIVGGLWNGPAGMAPPVQVADTGNPIIGAYADYDATGIALPLYFDATLPPKALSFVYVNGYNTTVEVWGGFVFRVDFNVLSPRCNPYGNPALSSIAYYGSGELGKAMVGALCQQSPLVCMSSEVWRTAELDICCPRWFTGCKPPTGYDPNPCQLQCYCGVEGSEYCEEPYSSYPEDYEVYGIQHCLSLPCNEAIGGHAQVAYTADGAKGYAITIGCESAFSVTVDDGDTWNQWGLIDTVIDCLGDVQVTLDCNKAYITSTNHAWNGCSSLCYPTAEMCDAYCDSVWRSEIDDTHGAIGQFWERVYCQEFSDCCCCQDYEDPGLLRLPYGEEHPEAVYLGDYDSTNMWYSLDQGQCWIKTPPTKINIQDFALEDEATVYVLNSVGEVSMSDAYGRHWTLPVDTLVGSGHTIAVMPTGNVLVSGVGVGTQVAFSDDSAATFGLTPVLPTQTAQGKVHIAFDNDYTTNSTIYAAVTGVGVYRLVIGDAAWADLNALPYNYYGIVLGYSDNTLYTPYCYSGVTVPTCLDVAVSGTIMVQPTYVPYYPSYDIVISAESVIVTSGYFHDGELVECISWDLWYDGDCPGYLIGEVGIMGVSSGATGYINIYEYVDLGCTPSTFTVENCLLVAECVGSLVTMGAEAGVARLLNPSETLCCDVDEWSYLEHINPVDVLSHKLCTCFSCEPSALRICGCMTSATDSTLWAIDCCPCEIRDHDHCCPVNSGYDMALGQDGTLWQYTDCVAKKAPTLVAPADGAVIPCDECDCGNAPFTLEWARLCTACNYEVLILDDQFNGVFHDFWEPIHGVGGAKPALLIPAATLGECGATYYWQVRVQKVESGDYVWSPWSTMGTFTIAASSGVLTLLSPDYGASDILRENIPFSWSAVGSATSYKFVLSASSDLSSPLAETELAGTSTSYAGPLDYSTSYYWQVTAMKNGDVLATSGVGTFSIEAAPPPEEPPPPEPEPAKWPPYAWAIIAIGAALMVVVIVLIWRTRRAA